MTKVFSILLLTALTVLSSCNEGGKAIEFEWKVYKSVLEHGDVTSAMNSLNRILTVDAYNADALDTLAILYLNSGANEAAAKIAFRALNVRQSDGIVKVLAKANKGLGKHDAALESFQKLLARNPNDLELLYETAYAQINLRKLNDALPSIQKIIQHPESGSAVMNEYIKEGSQLVPYKAVALNMLGFVQTQSGQSLEAIRSYEMALQIFPDYYLASNNLKLLSAQSAAK